MKLYKIKFLKDTELCRIGDIKNATKKNAESYIKNGFAEYVEAENKSVDSTTKAAIKKVMEKAGLKTAESATPKLSYPKVTLQVFKEKIHQWWYFTDDEIVDIMLCGLIGEKIGGDPLWIFIIAPPGALKTEFLRAFCVNDDFYPLSDLTSRTFVSGLTIGKDENRRKIEDLLPQLNGKVIIFKDFTTILEKSKEERSEIFAQLREIYDGSFSKKFGTMDKAIRYESRFGLIAGVTPVVDKYWKFLQQLGERFIKARWDEDIAKVTTRARETEGREKTFRKEIAESAMGFITNLDFTKLPSFDEEKYGSQLDKIAEFVAIGRTPISIQDERTEFYFDYIPTPERPTRLVKQLKKTARGLALIRGKEQVTDDEMKTLLRIARDTIPQDRLKILETITKNNSGLYGCARSIIVNEVKIPESSIRRVLEQLRLLDLVNEHKIISKAKGYSEEIVSYSAMPLVKSVLNPDSAGVGVTYTAGCSIS